MANGNSSLVEGDNAQYCTECGELKSFDEFHKAKTGKYGYRGDCKDCRSQKHKEYYEENKEKINRKSNEYYYNNIEKEQERKRQYYLENKDEIDKRNKRWHKENKEYFKKYSAKYREENKEEINRKNREYYYKNKDEIYKRRRSNKQRVIYDAVSARIRKALKGQCKSKSTEEIIGCSIEELNRHLEDQFEDGMTWENYGEWHIDHEIPCDVFDMTDEKQKSICWNYSNLQPLWAKDNLSKYNDIPNLFEGVEVDIENLISL